MSWITRRAKLMVDFLSNPGGVFASIRFILLQIGSTTLLERLALVVRFYIISFHVPCAHRQQEILSVARSILCLERRTREDIVEAGAYKGGSAAKLSLVARLTGRKLVVFDSFKGIPVNDEENTLAGRGQKRCLRFPEGSYQGSITEVKRNITKYGDITRCTFVKGWFDESMPTYHNRTAAVFLDVDLVASSKTCLKYLYPLLSEGGLLISDDGHIPAVRNLYQDRHFWEDEVGHPRPPVFRKGKLLYVKKNDWEHSSESAEERGESLRLDASTALSLCIGEHDRVTLLSPSGYRNIGQEAVVSGILKELTSSGRGKHILVTSREPEVSSRLHQEDCASFSNWVSLRFFFSFLLSQVIIVGGDELTEEKLFHHYPHAWQYFQGKTRLLMACISILIRKKTVFYKVGLSSIPEKYPSVLLRFALEHSRLVVVRNHWSRRIVRSLGIRRTILVGKDPAYNLPQIAVNSPEKREIGVCLGYPVHQSPAEQDALADYLEKWAKKDFDLCFFTFGNHPSLHAEDDYSTSKRFISCLKKGTQAYIFKETDPLKVKAKMTKMDMIISTRLHGAILADSIGVRFILLATCEKTRNFFSEQEMMTSGRVMEFSDLARHTMGPLG